MDTPPINKMLSSLVNEDNYDISVYKLNANSLFPVDPYLEITGNSEPSSTLTVKLINKILESFSLYGIKNLKELNKDISVMLKLSTDAKMKLDIILVEYYVRFSKLMDTHLYEFMSLHKTNTLEELIAHTKFSYVSSIDVCLVNVTDRYAFGYTVSITVDAYWRK